jgi:AraC-like DNA-binding protein
VLYLSYTPRAPLNEFVTRMWLVSGGQSPRRERILPSGTIELVINLRDDHVRIDRTLQGAHAKTFSGVVVSGTYSGAFIIDARQHASMMGVHFRPGGGAAVLGVPSVAFANTHVDLAAVWGEAAARELRERLCTAATCEARFQHLEATLIERLRSSLRPHPAVLIALTRLTAPGSRTSIREVARQSGLSHRRFLTIFAADVGLSPKLFSRIRRFQHVHALATRTGHIDWSQLALECGFYDQSHLTNEFRKLAGLTPTEYQQDIQTTRNLLRGHVAIG